MTYRKLFAALALSVVPAMSHAADLTAAAAKEIQTLKVSAKDWPHSGGWSHRNNVPYGKVVDKWDLDSGENILWTADLGSQTHGNTVVANGKVFVGGPTTTPGTCRGSRLDVDLGVLACFDEKTGTFAEIDQHPAFLRLVHDWPEMGICCSPACEGDRLYFVTSRGEVMPSTPRASSTARMTVRSSPRRTRTRTKRTFSGSTT